MSSASSSSSSSSLDEIDILHALQQPTVDELAHLLDARGLNPDLRLPSVCVTLLAYAVRKGSAPFATLLLDHGANVDAVSDVQEFGRGACVRSHLLGAIR